MKVWLLISVGCAECSGGDMPLTTPHGIYATDAGAIMASEVPASEWQERDNGNGYWTYTSHGTWEIHSIEIGVSSP